MGLSISDFKNAATRAFLTQADSHSGTPDGTTDTAEIDAYARDNTDLLANVEWQGIRRNVAELEFVASLAPERRAAIARRALETPARSTSANQPALKPAFTDEREQSLFERMLALKEFVQRRQMRPDLYSEVLRVVDGSVISPSQRAALAGTANELAATFTTRSPGAVTPFPGATDFVNAYVADLAESRAHDLQQTYLTAVRAGLVPGVSAGTDTIPEPSAEEKRRLSSYAAYFRRLADREAAQLLERHRGTFYGYNYNGIVTDLLTNPRQNYAVTYVPVLYVPSMPVDLPEQVLEKLMENRFPRETLKVEECAELARVVIQRLGPNRLARLEPSTVALLTGALVREHRVQAHYGDGRQHFVIQSTHHLNKEDKAALTALRAATEPRLTWKSDSMTGAYELTFG